MSRNWKIVVPAVVAIAMTVGGVALAGSNSDAAAYEQALYGEPNPFVAVQAPAQDTGWTTAGDPRVRTDLQQANTATAPQVNWTSRNAVDREDTGRGAVHDPE